MITTLLLAITIATADTTKLPPNYESERLYSVINAGRIVNNLEELQLDSAMTYMAYRNCRKPNGNTGGILYVASLKLDHETAATILLNKFSTSIFNPYYRRVGVYIHKNVLCVLLM